MLENPSIPAEGETSKFLAYETRISELSTEVTRLKVENVSLNNRITTLQNMLHTNGIPLPEEKEEIEKKEQILLKEKKVIPSVHVLLFYRSKKRKR